MPNSISQTALSLISSSMRLIKVLSSGEQLPIADANDALAVFNQMVDAWNAERLMIFTTSASDFPLVANKQAYTMGPGGDFDTVRPAQIDSMSAILLTNPSVPLEIPMTMYTVDEWQTKVPVKNVSGTFPYICYDDGGSPLRTLNMWPIPVMVNNVRIYSWQPLTIAAALTTPISYPPGYAEAFRYNLAMRLNGEFDGKMTPGDMQIAVDSMARIKTMNAPDLRLQSDLLPSPFGYNYKASEFGIPY